MVNSPIFSNTTESQDYVGPFPQLECCGVDNPVFAEKKASLGMACSSPEHFDLQKQQSYYC